MEFCEFFYAVGKGIVVCCCVPNHLGDHMLETADNRALLEEPILSAPLDPFEEPVF